MDTSSMRGPGCMSIIIGIPAAIAGLVVLYAGMIYAFSPDVSAGRALIDRGAYHLTVFIFSIVFCVLACLPLIHGIDLLVTASRVESDAATHTPKSWHHHNTPVENTGGISYDGSWPNGLYTYVQGNETVTVQSGYNESTGEYWQETSREPNGDTRE